MVTSAATGGPNPGTDGIGPLVERLGLEPHPEGGWFRRSWTAPDVVPDSDPARAAASSILYLLPVDAASQWHRIDASESWTHAGGAAVRLEIWAEGDERRGRHTLGPDVIGRDEAQVVVPPGAWQRARSRGEWSLVVCTVVPEFRFDSFELAPPGWQPPA